MKIVFLDAKTIGDDIDRPDLIHLVKLPNITLPLRKKLWNA